MGGPRADAATQPQADPASLAGSTERGRGPGARRRWAAVGVYLLAGLVLFLAYLRLSETHTLNSDSANILLMGWDLLHGKLLLSGWHMSDVSFYPTELPQYALLEAVLGLHMQTAHVAAAMTYTLTFLFAVVLARSGSSGRAAWIRTLVVAGIMLAPQLGLGVWALDLSVGHIGTSVPLLLTWLLLDKMAPRWYVPVLTAVLLAWVLVADPIAYVVGLGPVGIAGAAWVIRGLVKGSGHWNQRIADQWYPLSLGVATVAAAAIAWIFNSLVSDLGGYFVNRLPFSLTPWGDLHNNVPAFWRLLQVFGADFSGLHGLWFGLAVLHLASVLVVGWALVCVFRRFFGVSLVDQVLALAVVLNVVLYMLTNASNEAAHEVAIILPFGAVLAARVLIRAVRPDQAAVADYGRSTLSGVRSRRSRRVRLAACAAGIAVLAGYTVGLADELTQPTVPAANAGLGSWLLAHHLTYGLSGYWESSSVTVDSDNRVQVRSLALYTLQPDLWMSNVDWYNPSLHYANFVILDSKPGYFSYWEPAQLVYKYFGIPVRTYHHGPYTILVFNKNLLEDLPLRSTLGISPGQLSASHRAKSREGTDYKSRLR